MSFWAIANRALCAGTQNKSENHHHIHKFDPTEKLRVVMVRQKKILVQRNIFWKWGDFFFLLFSCCCFRNLWKVPHFHKKITFSEEDTRKYKDDMPGDLSSSYYEWILAKTQKKIRGAQNGNKKIRGGMLR